MSDKKHDDSEVEVFRTMQRHKTLRWLIVGSFTCLGMWIISDAVVRIYSRPEPPWVTIVLAIVAALAVGGMPGYAMIIRFRMYMKGDRQRLVELESKVDPQRTSSGLDTAGISREDKHLDV